MPLGETGLGAGVANRKRRLPLGIGSYSDVTVAPAESRDNPWL